MHPSTIVTRTEAGNAELALPAHGLSLTQRRFLTLLDTSCSVDELARRHATDAARLERDLTRLAQLGLVARDAPAPAGPPAAPLAAVRLGPSALAHRLPFVLLPVAAAVAAWLAWQHWGAPATALAPPDAVDARPPATAHAGPAATDPQPIATRVLKGEPTERARDVKVPRAAPKDVEAPAPDADSAARPALRVEHRSPPPAGDSRPAAAAVAALATPPSHQPVAEPPQPNPSPAATAPTPAIDPPASTAAHAAAAPAPVPGAKAAAPADPAPVAPVHLASAGPAAGLVHEAPARALVPIARESPAFPREAIAAGLSAGNVKARLTIDARGNVTDVAVVETSHRAFTRAVHDALARWRFDPGAPSRTTIVDVAFKRD